MTRIFKPVALLCVLFIGTGAGAQTSKKDADLKAPDGINLKVTFYSAGKPGPGVLLMHQCNRDRKTWDPLATQLAEAGIHVLTLDYRGFGESGGERRDSLPMQQMAAEQRKWPGDIDVAYQYLLAQPGVDSARIGAGGASCGVNNSIQLGRRHPEVKTLVLLSGNTDMDGIKYLESATGVPLFMSASEDDGDTVEQMQWLLAFSRNPLDKIVVYKAAGHGTEMFKVEKGLEPQILEWYEARLLAPPASITAVKPTKPSPSAEIWDQLTAPGGAARVKKQLEEARKKNPDASLFPEFAVNYLGYQYLQQGDTKAAIEVFKLNEFAYPRSANVYDSLGDAYLADNQKELAIEYSEKAIQMLSEDHSIDEARAKLIRESAEDKLHQLQPK
ncbi:MAG TPA: alpha/beta hydrolase [Candidatus Sulfotelmatobacter sp.]|nr:alpha/beta hydrolase [Candidatus Sulfotelmatobacter sp.]